ncbi:MAG TPA: ATPase domain-containing protein [Candidatus Acidoferrum sp.]|nr:ATPase domain-containing protein [Candidatus Acidoferrum sp.]
MPTGIAGLDTVLRGGLPPNRVYLAEGSPGVGKTTLALQFLLEGMRRGEKVLYIALSESKEEIEAVAKSHGWSLHGMDILEISALENQLRIKDTGTLFHPSEVELQNLVKALLDTIDRLQPARVAFDSLSELRILSDSGLRYRRQLLRFKQFFMGRGCTVLFLDDSDDKSDVQVRSIAHGVIVLERLAATYGVERRRLRVDKVRGLKFQEGNHDYVIERGGVQVFPRLVALDMGVNFPAESFESGIGELDKILGGGITRGTSTLFLGPAGISKTTLCLQFAFTAAKAGRPVLFFTFEENLRVLRQRAKGVGIDIEPLERNGTLKLQRIDPAEMTPGRFAQLIRAEIERKAVEIVVIDSLNGYMNAMPDERFLMLHMHDLLSYLALHGVTTLMTLAQSGMVGPMSSPADITYLADTVVMLRFFEAAGAVKKAISVMKKRSTRHEETIREFSVDSHGLRVGEPLLHFRGVLTGVPTFTGDSGQMIKERDELQRR